MSEFTTVAKVGSIPDGQGITVAVGDRLIAVFNSCGSYFAIDDMCPHMGASLGAGGWKMASSHALGMRGGSKSATALGAIIRESRSAASKFAWSAMKSK